MAEKEYIERDKAIKTYIELLRCPGEIFVTDISDILQQLPAADVRPVVRGHIVDMRYAEDDGEWKCTHCGWQYTLCVCGKDVTSKIRFCPNCGAWMEES